VHAGLPATYAAMSANSVTKLAILEEAVRFFYCAHRITTESGGAMTPFVEGLGEGE